MPAPNEISVVRQAALHLTFNEILEGELQLPENEPPFLLCTNGIKTQRFNALATIINKEKIGSITNFLMDDGTAVLVARFFEESKNLENLNLGDMVLLIGKIRLFNEEIYLSPEIIKKVSPLWMKHRFLERSKLNQTATIVEDKPHFEMKEQNVEVKKERKTITKETIVEKEIAKEKIVKKEIAEEEIVEEDLVVGADDNSFPFQKIGTLIREMDSGSGVLIEELLEKSPLRDSEALIKKMLEKGDIYQITPGKVKLL
ncbi:hypothetical protein HYU21_04120 [Candidatus Woesearchaeota archaeon]|nr:hypothetical protein [Candidatus Woesearchaeota archaeon]